MEAQALADKQLARCVTRLIRAAAFAPLLHVIFLPSLVKYSSCDISKFVFFVFYRLISPVLRRFSHRPLKILQKVSHHFFFRCFCLHP